MTDYGLKMPTRMRVLVPTCMPYCSKCRATFNLVDLDDAKARAVLGHPPNVIDPQCEYAGRFFEVELDVRYLKECAAPRGVLAVTDPRLHLGVFLTSREFREVQSRAFFEGRETVYSVLQALMDGHLELPKGAPQVLRDVETMMIEYKASRRVLNLNDYLGD